MDFQSVKDATAALHRLDGSEFETRTLNVSYSVNKVMDAADKVSSKELFVGNLSAVTTDDGLCDAFTGALSARIMRDSVTRESKR